jgi:hypothetical protein
VDEWSVRTSLEGGSNFIKVRPSFDWAARDYHDDVRWHDMSADESNWRRQKSVEGLEAEVPVGSPNAKQTFDKFQAS